MTRRGPLTDEQIAASLEHSCANLRNFILSPPADSDLRDENIDSMEWLLEEAANRIRLLAGCESEPEAQFEPFPPTPIPVVEYRECHVELMPDELKP